MQRPRRLILSGLVATLVALSCVFYLLFRGHRSKAGTDPFLALLDQGASDYERRNFESAAAIFARAVVLQSQSLDAQLDLSNAYLADNKPEQAIPPAQAAIKIDPGSAAAYYLLGCANVRLARYEEALKALQQSEHIDTHIAAVHFQIGLAQRGLDHLEDAAGAFQKAIDLEPRHPAAHYALGQALMQLGRKKQASAELEIHNEIAEKIKATANKDLAVNASTFERCVYTEAHVPFQLAEQPLPNATPVSFIDVTASALGPGASKFKGPVGILDLDHTGRPGLLVAEGDAGFRFLRNDGGTFAATGKLLPTHGAPWRQVVVGDLQNDGIPDAVVLGEKGTAVFTFNPAGQASDISASSGLASVMAGAGVLADFDFTGKLSLLTAPPDGSGLRTWRNQLNLTFKEVAGPSGAASLTAVTGLQVNDWNSDDLPDLFVARGAQPPFLLSNQRGGPLTAEGSPSGWPAAGARGAIAVGDLNNDLRTDLLVARDGGIDIVMGGEQRRITLPTGDFKVSQLLLLDYDNDGWLDVIAAGDRGLRAWRNLGQNGFRETTSDLGLDRLITAPIVSVASLDFNSDGAPDLLLTLGDGSLRLLENHGAGANHCVSIFLRGKRSNSLGLGSRVELTAGGWRTIREYDSNPLLIGTGSHTLLDRLTTHWFDLAVSSPQVAVGPPGKPMEIEEIQLPTGSCPNLYAWDGERFRYVADILGSAPAGLPLSENRFIDADTDELVHIGDDSRLRPREGAYELAITDELREVTYLDEANLVAVDHPAGTEVISTSKLLPGKPFPPAGFLTVGNRHPLLRAQRSDGQEVTDALQAEDASYVSPPRVRPPQLRGLAEPWSVTLDFGPLPVNKPTALVLSGWLRFGGGMANIAASHNPDLPFPFPQLEVETADGRWQAVNVVVGAPSGKNKTIVVDLTGRLPEDARRLRLSTAFEIHWDRIALFEIINTGGAGAVTQSIRLEHWLAPDQADLNWHGFGIYEDHPSFMPLTPSHDNLKQTPPWRITPSGWCTRYGDVSPLLAHKDDALVLLASGDEITLRFAADRLPPRPQGWKRDFFLFSSGWDKDADYHVAAGETIEPLPWHGMNDQRYGKEVRTADDLQWAKKYNTRWVGPLTLPRSP